MKKDKKNKDKKPLKFLNVTLIIIGICTFVFTVIMFVFFALFQSIPDTLCERFFTCVVGECSVMGIIQVVKTICKHKYLGIDIDNLENLEECNEEVNDYE